ncbi:MAG TPA: hypothetical protein VN704_05805, partial [Verrucomicrobiae bacterium]|nr:hypothetical protein [Verrucomicrobiae bacterium]
SKYYHYPRYVGYTTYTINKIELERELVDFDSRKLLTSSNRAELHRVQNDPNITELKCHGVLNLNEVSIPSNTKIIYVGRIEGNLKKLPKTLLELHIMDDFSKKLKVKYLPKGLKKLCMERGTFNFPIDELPESLEELEIRSHEFDKSVNRLPVGLRSFYLAAKLHKINLDNLPPNLRILELSAVSQDYSPFSPLYVDNDGPTKLAHNKLDKLPSGLVNLSLHGHLLNIKLFFLPEGLESLTLETGIYSYPLNHLPTSLKNLILNTNLKKRTHLSDSIENLVLDNCMNDKSLNLIQNYPRNLKTLTISHQAKEKTIRKIKAIISKNTKVIINKKPKINIGDADHTIDIETGLKVYN